MHRPPESALKKANLISALRAAFWVITEMDVSGFQLAAGKFTVSTLPKSGEWTGWNTRLGGHKQPVGCRSVRERAALSALWWPAAVMNNGLLRPNLRKFQLFNLFFKNNYRFSGSAAWFYSKLLEPGGPPGTISSVTNWVFLSRMKNMN